MSSLPAAPRRRDIPGRIASRLFSRSTATESGSSSVSPNTPTTPVCVEEHRPFVYIDAGNGEDKYGEEVASRNIEREKEHPPRVSSAAPIKTSEAAHLIRPGHRYVGVPRPARVDYAASGDEPYRIPKRTIRRMEALASTNNLHEGRHKAVAPPADDPHASQVADWNILKMRPLPNVPPGDAPSKFVPTPLFTKRRTATEADDVETTEKTQNLKECKSLRTIKWVEDENRPERAAQRALLSRERESQAESSLLGTPVLETLEPAVYEPRRTAQSALRIHRKPVPGRSISSGSQHNATSSSVGSAEIGSSGCTGAIHSARPKPTSSFNDDDRAFVPHGTRAQTICTKDTRALRLPRGFSEELRSLEALGDACYDTHHAVGGHGKGMHDGSDHRSMQEAINDHSTLSEIYDHYLESSHI